MQTYEIIGLTYLAVGIITWIVMAFEYNKSKSFGLSENRYSNIMIWACRILVGLLFLYSGFVKINDYIGFGYKLEEYFVVFGKPFTLLAPSAEFFAFLISVFEMALAVAILTGFRMKITAWLTLLMMIFFTWLTGFSHYTGKVTDCGCFGDALKIAPWESFTKDIFLLILIIPIFRVREFIKAIPTEKIALIAVAAFTVICASYAIYCHENLPRVDYRAYKKGVDLAHCTTYEAPPDGIPKCKDWDDIIPSEIKYFEGKVLMIVMYDMTKASEKGMEKSKALYQDLQNSDITVVASTATPPSGVEKFQAAPMSLPYPFTFKDGTALKTIVRSNPGYMLLQDGIIIEKWHHNNTPTAEEIHSLLK